MLVTVLVTVLSTEGNRVKEGSDLQDGGSVRLGVLECVLQTCLQHEAVSDDQIRGNQVSDLGR